MFLPLNPTSVAARSRCASAVEFRLDTRYKPINMRFIIATRGKDTADEIRWIARDTPDLEERPVNRVA
jgi:hypothetical protein